MSVRPAVRERIVRCLRTIEEDEGVTIAYACESGSRAWGFASSDSDYDVRFIYVRPSSWYLTIDVDRRRDVVERLLDDTLDVSGWDVRKALQLLQASNVTLFEWLQSPIVYVAHENIVSSLRGLREACYSPKSAAYHYLNMARSISRRYLKGDAVRLKRYFYMLRPLLACGWIVANGGIPPLEFEMLAEAQLDRGELRRAVADLLRRKRQGEELGEAPRVPLIDGFIRSETEHLSDAVRHLDDSRADVEILNDAFRTIVTLSERHQA